MDLPEKGFIREELMLHLSSSTPSSLARGKDTLRGYPYAPCVCVGGCVGVQMLFDLGQMVGSVGGGYASSHSRRPVAVIFFMIVLLVLPLIGLEKLPNLHTTCVLILLAGTVCLSASAPLIG